MERLQPPSALCLTGNLSENWRRFKQQFQIYLTATGIDQKEDGIKASTFLHVIGPESLEIYNTFTFENAGDKNKLDPIMGKFQTYCNPRKNLTYERHIFNTRNQQTGENIDAYVTDLKNKASLCEFDALKDSLIKDRIVCGVRSDEVRARLLRIPDLSLEKAIDICRAAETSETQLKSLAEEKPIDLLHNRGKFRPKQKQVKKEATQQKVKQPSKEPSPSYKCQKCGYTHEKKKCPAFGKKCNNCKKSNHFARMCRRQKVHAVDGNNQDSEDSDVDYDQYFVEAVENSSNHDRDWKIVVEINGKKLEMKLDTGAQVNVLPLKVYTRLSRSPLKRSRDKLISYSGHKLNTIGKATLLVGTKDKFSPVEFQVVDHKAQPVLGLQSCLELQLIKRMYTVNTEDPNQLLHEYSDVFQGLGCLPGEYNIQLQDNSKPVIHPPRKIPFAQRNKVKKELNRMVKDGVIEAVKEPSDWVNSIVVAEKPNKKDVRICLDPRDLNKYIMREHYPMKTVEEVAATVEGATVFSVLDASSGFWQIKLKKDCTNLTVFNTPFGRYKFLRMPFGLASSPEVWQRAVCQIYENMEGCAVIADDILVWGSNIEEHNKRLRTVLQKARDSNLKPNKSKCKIGLPEVTYVGHTFTKNGLKASQSHVEAILQMDEPQNKTELMRFNGMINYLGKYIPNLSSLNKPLRQLLEKDIAWHWTEKHSRCFQQLKEAITKAPVLKYYDQNQGEITLQVDASKDGLGACIMQNEQPIAYGSRSLTKTEQNYAQIEKEMLAIVYGATKFHQYLYGQKVTVESDHRALEILFKKPLYLVPPRIAKMMLKVQKYDLHVMFKPGKEMFISDTLSRAPLKTAIEEENIREYTVFSIGNLPVSQEIMSKIKHETENDMVMIRLRETILQGWPEIKQNVNPCLRQYWNYRDELSEIEGLILKGERIVVPKSMQKEMLDKIHNMSHLGVQKCLRRAREIVFWPGINGQIKDKVAMCEICNEFRNSQAKQPLKPHEIPERPWQILGTDLFELDGQNYLILVDYYSKFFEVSKISGTGSELVINVLKQNFARHGIPEKLMSDNGPCYASQLFTEFAKAYQFDHVTSSPRYPRSNGMSERAVQTVKKLLKKAKKSGNDPYLALLELRNTPIDGLGSPTQLLMGRRTRTILPMKCSLLNPDVVKVNVPSVLSEKQQVQKKYYDRNTKLLKPLELGDQVRIQSDKKTWEPGVVEGKCMQPRSYNVKTESGSILRRNREHILKTKENRQLKQQIDIDVDDDDCQPQYQDRKPEIFPSPPQTTDSGEKVTSSGRVVKMPKRFEDFVMSLEMD